MNSFVHHLAHMSQIHGAEKKEDSDFEGAKDSCWCESSSVLQNVGLLGMFSLETMIYSGLALVATRVCSVKFTLGL